MFTMFHSVYVHIELALAPIATKLEKRRWYFSQRACLLDEIKQGRLSGNYYCPTRFPYETQGINLR